MIMRMLNKTRSKFLNLLKTDGSLSQKAARGGVWIFSSYIFSKTLAFIRTIILARLLAPGDFGLMGIALVATGAMEVFTETGINSALIQRKEVSGNILNTAWAMSICRGVIFFVLLYLLSPFIAYFYNTDRLEILLKVIAFGFLFSGFQNTGIVLLDKELNFKKKAVFTLSIDISNIIFSVIFAFVLRNVWALVIGYVAGAFVGLVTSYRIQAFKPSFKFDFRIAKELFQFGKHIFGAGIFMFFVTQGDNAVVGKVLGMGALGFYAFAYNLSILPVTAITYLISQVSVPAYSKVQDEIARLSRGYLRVLKFTSFLATPLAVGLFILAPEFIRIVYGPKWMPMVPALQVLCFLGFFRSIAATMGPVFMAVGKPSVMHRIKFYEFILMAVIIYPFVKRVGIAGAAIAVTIVYLLSLTLHYINLVKILKGIQLEIVKSVSRHIMSALIMAAALYLIKQYIFSQIMLIQLIFLILAGVSSYLAANLILDKRLTNEMNEILGYLR